MRADGHLYDAIGVGYAAKRVADPAMAAQIERALGDARRVLNVGAGAGSYESTEREIVAVEPSMVMVAQRGESAAPVVRAVAEGLPVASGSFDATLTVLSVHHWRDRATGYAELRRVAPKRVVLTYEPTLQKRFWLIEDYLPGVARFEAGRVPTVEEVAEGIGATRVEVVPVAHDCRDAILPAHWRRPEAYLDPEVLRSASGVVQSDQDEVRAGIERLRADLASGAWYDRYGHLLDEDELDVGFRLVVAG